jgi:tetratricopeptide (TPR) repeat protein
MQLPHDPFAFLASRMDGRLSNLRGQIYDLGVRSGRPIWVAGHSLPNLNGQPRDEVQATCLRYARAASEFIVVVDGSYGSPWNAADLCVLELEMLTAALAGKPFHLFLLEPYEPDPRIEGLLRAVQLARRDVADVKPKAEIDILSELTTQFEGSHAYPARTRPPRRRVPTQENLDVRFLDGGFMPLHPEPPSEELVLNLLRNVDPSTNEAARLVDAWMALRHLCSAPYSDPTFSAYLPLWDAALSRWASAAAWYGLHGAHYLGRLAAVNTLLWIRQQATFRATTEREQLAIQGTYGGLASEYHSMAKLAETRREKRILFERALATANRALDGEPRDPSGLYGIRASILQALGRLRQGLDDYRRMLDIRTLRGEDHGRIGEAEPELGMGYLRLGHIFRAGDFLTRGVANLERSDRHPFTVRALRKLAVFYLVTLRLHKALRTLRRAAAIAREREIRGQLSQIEPLLRRLELLDWRGWFHRPTTGV